MRYELRLHTLPNAHTNYEPTVVERLQDEQQRHRTGKTTSLSVSHFGTANNVSADDDDDDGDDVAAPLPAHEANITEKIQNKKNFTEGPFDFSLHSVFHERIF